MGSETPTKSLLRGDFGDAGRAPERVASGGEEEGEGGGGRGGEETEERNRGRESTESMEASNWEMVVELVQTAFREGRLVEEATWQVVVLTSKGKMDYLGIGLVEVMWKVVAEI